MAVWGIVVSSFDLNDNHSRLDLHKKDVMPKCGQALLFEIWTHTTTYVFFFTPTCTRRWTGYQNKEQSSSNYTYTHTEGV